MEIKTTDEIKDMSYVDNHYLKGDKYYPKKWVAVDDVVKSLDKILEFLENLKR